MNKHGAALWNCVCDCGNECVKIGFQLTSGKTKSCGCLRGTGAIVHGHASAGRKSPTYSSWRSMIGRCYNRAYDSYEFYGGKGVVVCDEWKGCFEAFLRDMGERPAGTTIDRLDSSGDYEPSNCRWATAEQQAHNRGDYKTNKSGARNVHWRKNRWIVVIKKGGKSHYFGSFTDVDAAAIAASDGRALLFPSLS